MEKGAERIDYAYDPNGRLVGRTASSAVDGLPKEVTFVWDDVTDRLVAMFDAGASTATLTAAPTPNAGLRRQYLHGDRAYDDPLVIQTAGKTYFPFIDETATGNLTAVLDDAGHLVERVLYADAYGDAPRYLHGAVADRIDIEATKTATGEIASIEIRAHFSERIDPATLATGAHLTAVDPTNAITFRSPAIPTISSDYTLVWTLSASDWHALTTAPNTHALEIALTSTLRFAGWPTQPLTPAPTWTTRLFHSASSADSPVILREPLTSFHTLLAGIGAGGTAERNLYAIADLYLAASATSKSQLFDFKARPLRDPATGLIYARARWYDAETGAFLTPDSLGYLDSSNLYAAFANDPVNNGDPTGECIGLDSVRCRDYAFDAVMQFADGRNSWGNLKRSTRFAAFELKGSALAIPRLAKGIYDVASHPVETWAGLTSLTISIAEDPIGMAKRAGTAIINADPDAAGEFTGEALFLAGLGAAARTPQVASALQQSSTAFRTWAATNDAASDVIWHVRQLRPLHVMAVVLEPRRMKHTFGPDTPVELVVKA